MRFGDGDRRLAIVEAALIACGRKALKARACSPRHGASADDVIRAHRPEEWQARRSSGGKGVPPRTAKLYKAAAAQADTKGVVVTDETPMISARPRPVPPIRFPDIVPRERMDGRP